MKPKTLILMGVAIVCGLVASYMTSRLIADNKATVIVCVAKEDVNEFEMIAKPQDKFEPKEMLHKEAPKDFIPPDKLDTIVGKQFKKTVKKGGTLTMDDMFQGSGSLDTTIKEGWIAKSVRITPETAVAGFIVPGTHVDVYQLKSSKSKLVLEDVPILAVDLLREKPQDRPGINGGTVTLQLLKEEVTMLMDAQGGGGSLELVLRSASESQAPDKKKAAFKSMAANAPVPVPPPPPPPPPVEVKADPEKPTETIEQPKPRSRMVVFNGQRGWIEGLYQLDDKGTVVGTEYRTSQQLIEAGPSPTPAPATPTPAPGGPAPTPGGQAPVTN